MRRPLSQLPPGTRFLQPDLQIIGTLLTVTASAAKVELERPMQAVEFTDPESGERRSFVASRSKLTTWAPSVTVQPIGTPDPESENEMAKKATAKKPRVKTTKAERELKKRQKAAEKSAPAAKKQGRPAKPPKAEKPAKEPKAKRGSALDAAYLVLKSNGGGMTCQQMIDEMAARKLWTSPGGKTPAATLYAAICREVENKGAEARFEKVERGTFKAK